jgi:beta-mannosidase
MKERYLHAWLSREEGVNYIRKMPCNYGWDWGPRLVTCGIWKDIELLSWSTGRIADVNIEQMHRGAVVILQVETDLKTRAKVGNNTRLNLSVSVRFQGEKIAAVTGRPDRRGKVTCEIVIKSPQLWWPAGYGQQPLYTVHVDLLDDFSEVLDSWTKRIGLRTCELQQTRDLFGRSFLFVVNGEPIYAKGANWIPADAFVTRVSDEKYRSLLTSARDANMNMIRVWGGGVYEQELFYDICDELGICVWQDFMFACACYPTFDHRFMRNVAVEAEQNVSRLRHHACIALWCGNNELEQGICGSRWSIHQMPWRQYSKLFDKVLPRIIDRLDANRSYWPGSPHNPLRKREDCNNPEAGDAHLWSVWHGGEPFEWFRNAEHRFVSEFGFQSFPGPDAIRRFTVDTDRNISSPVMDQRQKSWVGNGAIMSYMLAWFRLPKDFDSFTILSQVLQGLALKYGIESFRRHMPRNMGTLYWQLNDTWPGPSWSTIDYFGQWKASHYFVKRAFAPVVISMVEDIAAGTIECWIISDQAFNCAGTLRIEISTAAGRALWSGEKHVRVRKKSSACRWKLNVRKLVGSNIAWPNLSSVPAYTAGGVPMHNFTQPEDLFAWSELHFDNGARIDALCTFVKPKHLPLKKPQISVRVTRSENATITVQFLSKTTALYVWLELDGKDVKFSDNYVHLRPGRTRSITVSGTQLSTKEFRRRLRVKSLYDTFN